ncbi:peptide chain release factor 2 [Helicovermis profundi]|uniref:Peptide chain release factor 2 n=2 Tax=Helicovermis profundi TaxID=3065157 RepID=A0AAU9E0K9_9FIRM|nr:peptide chain release factor 2 [Clostridia bacterium S502]
MLNPKFWDDNEKAQKVLQRSNSIKLKIDLYNVLLETHEDINILIEMLLEDEEENMVNELNEKIEYFNSEIEKSKLESLLSGEYDHLNAILSIHAGTGGLDAQDWAEMLMRMYSRYADKKGYKIEIIDLIRDTEAGIKTATLLIKGLNAYGFLKSEKGVHRLVRISPFDSSGKRHTSFASIDIMPEIEMDNEVLINSQDIKIDTYRASGAGGQHINKTDSAVRITHIPTGVVVQCQNQRSQHLNKETAMKYLMGKLIELKDIEQKERIEDIQGDYSQIAWGSQIRSYVFHPYNLVKDHRTNVENGNVQAVMDGDINLFIDSYLVYKMKENRGE